MKQNIYILQFGKVRNGIFFCSGISDYIETNKREALRRCRANNKRNRTEGDIYRWIFIKAKY